MTVAVEWHCAKCGGDLPAEYRPGDACAACGVFAGAVGPELPTSPLTRLALRTMFALGMFAGKLKPAPKSKR